MLAENFQRPARIGWVCMGHPNHNVEWRAEPSANQVRSHLALGNGWPVPTKQNDITLATFADFAKQVISKVLNLGDQLLLK